MTVLRSILIAATALPLAIAGAPFFIVGAFLSGIGKQLIDSAEYPAEFWQRVIK